MLSKPARQIEPLPAWLEAMLPAGRRHDLLEVTAQNGAAERMAVMRWGEGRPVLMVHGNPTWGFLYRKVVAALVGEPVQLIVPDRVAAMVLLNTIVGPPKPGFRPTLFHRLSQAPGLSDLLFRGLSFPQRVLWSGQGDRSSIRGDVTRAYTWPLRRFADRTAPLALARMVPDSMQHPSIADLHITKDFIDAFKGPAAIVWGERDPILGKLRRRVHRSLPHATMEITRGGHFLQEEVPELIAKAILEVVGKL